MQQYLATYTRILKRFALPNHRFEKALVEDGHVFKGIFMVLAMDWQYSLFIIRRNCLENPVSRLGDL